MLSNMTNGLSRNVAEKLPKIGIVGAGVAGLSLAIQLQKHKIPYSIFEARTSESVGHRYGVTLNKRACKVVYDELGTPFDNQWKHLQSQIAVDHVIGGDGKGDAEEQQGQASFLASDKDLRESLLDALHKDQADVHWGHKLTSITSLTNGAQIGLGFEGMPSSVFDVVVDAGGLRSPASDYFSPSQKPKLLPYATYQGTRRISSKDFFTRYQRFFEDVGGRNKISYTQSTKQYFFQIQKVHFDHKEAQDHVVEIRWIFSRPAGEVGDSLFRPNRSPQEAKEIPDSLFAVIREALSSVPPSSEANLLNEILALKDLEQDRVLNWHLRVKMQNPAEFTNHLEGSASLIYPIGDAAHGLPIVRSNGANLAMEDAGCLSSLLRSSATGTPSSKEWVQSRYDPWFRATVAAIQALRKCHGQVAWTRRELEDFLGFWHEVSESERDKSSGLDLSREPEDQSPTGVIERSSPKI